MADPKNNIPVVEEEQADLPASAPSAAGALPGATANVASAKGVGISVPGAGALDAETTKKIIDRLQQYADERDTSKGFLNPLMRGLNMAYATTYGPDAAQRTQAQYDVQDKDVINTLGTVGSLKTSLARNEELAKLYGGEGAGAGTTPVVGGAPAGSAGSIQSDIARLPKLLQKQAMGAYLNQDWDGLNKIMSDYAIKGATPEMKNLEYIDTLEPGKADTLRRQLYPNMYTPQKRILPSGATQEYNPLDEIPRGAPTSGAEPLGQVARQAGIPSDAIISEDRDATTQLSLIDRPDPNKPGHYLTKEGNPVALPNKSAHQIPGSAFDLRRGFVPTAVQRQALIDSGAIEVHPGHWEYPQGVGTRTSLTAAPATTVSAPTIDTSTQGVAQKYKNIGEANTVFNENVYKPLATNIKSNQDEADSADRVLQAIPKGGERGPASSIKQSAIGLKMATGLPVSPEEEAFYMSNLDIEQVKKQAVALGAKAAMGSQYTGKESENFEKTLAGINNPNEFIKTTYQIKKAKALVDLAHEKFLRSHPDEMLNAESAWENSGEREKIFRKTVDAFKNAPKATENKVASSIESQAKNSRFGAYEPDKWTYGTDEKGFYREPK